MWWWLILALYVLVSIVGWVVTGRYKYRELAADPQANKYAAYSNYRKVTEEERLDACRKEAILYGAWSFLWPWAVVAAPFVGAYHGIGYLITSDVDKELEKKKQFEAAQKIVDEYNAKKKAEEEKVWDELLPAKEPSPWQQYNKARPLKCRNCGLPHRTRDCDEED